MIRRITMPAILCLVFISTAAGQTNPFESAARNAIDANEAFRRCRHFVEGWLEHVDPETGLIPRNLTKDRDIWNAKDSAADNYPFMVLTSALTDEPLFRGRMREILRMEKRLTCRLDHLPDAWSFSKHTWADSEPDIERIIFGASEYVKDGLMPLTEWLGPSPWADRMLNIVDDIWKHAPVETPYGRIPSTNQEVNGEILQTMSRLYWMTGRQDYLAYAIRLGDYYLFDHLPTSEGDTFRLRDHSCEIISGLSELYLTVHFVQPEKKKAYQKPIHAMYDRILEIGVNKHGLMYNRVDLKTGMPIDERASDGWGYIYDGFYTVWLVDRSEPYLKAVIRALSNLNMYYRDYVWEGAKRPNQPYGSADGYADSIEGAINLFNRQPVPSAADWIDSQIHNMFSIQQPDGIIEGWHGDGNFARTAIMYALWKTQGTTIAPWREDLRFGAVRAGRTVYIHIEADKPWEGKLRFDQPRHKVYLNLPIDYPRINQFPEWFTVEKNKLYAVSVVNQARRHSGSSLIEGLPIALTSDALEMNLSVTLIEQPTAPSP